MEDYKIILLVEDNPGDAELTLKALQDKSLANKIEWVRDGVEALDFLFRRGTWEGRASSDPVLILLDLNMPRLDGHDVLQSVKGDPTLRRIPVVIMTSSREGPDLHKAYDLGANAYVVKPLNFKEFVTAVKNIGTFWALINEPPPGSPK
jgi:CheY-like chemotaxis protein